MVADCMALNPAGFAFDVLAVALFGFDVFMFVYWLVRLCSDVRVCAIAVSNIESLFFNLLQNLSN